MGVLGIIDGNKVIRGNSRYGNVVGMIDGDKVIIGNSRYGTVIGIIDGGGYYGNSFNSLLLL